MMYAALPMRTQTEKATFSCKDNCILTKHTRAEHIPQCASNYDLCRTGWTRCGFMESRGTFKGPSLTGDIYNYSNDKCHLHGATTYLRFFFNQFKLANKTFMCLAWVVFGFE